MSAEYPSYVALWRTGQLQQRAEQATQALGDCTLCPRQCHADRLKEPPSGAYCRTGRLAVVSSAFPHHGEEGCLRGYNGSGTIFFCHCNLRCVFCQNFDISWEAHGRPVDCPALARLMLRLQDAGCHNINFVTPSHVVAQILEALVIAVEQGLRMPLVYNSGGYDRVETLRLLEGVFDIYMPDLKFLDPAAAKLYFNAEDYPQVVCDAIREMHRQVGALELDSTGLARRGVLVRHLVMPGYLEDTRRVMRFLAKEISPDTFVNVMAQYHPAGRARRYPPLDRPLSLAEYRQALRVAKEEGLHRFARD